MEIFYHVMRPSIFVKYAISVERIGLEYVVRHYRNNKLKQANSVDTLNKVVKWLDVYIGQGLFDITLREEFIAILTKSFVISEPDPVRYRIIGVALGQVTNDDGGIVTLYQRLSGKYCIRETGVCVRTPEAAEVDLLLARLNLKDNIPTHTFD